MSKDNNKSCICPNKCLLSIVVGGPTVSDRISSFYIVRGRVLKKFPHRGVKPVTCYTLFGCGRFYPVEIRNSTPRYIF